MRRHAIDRVGGFDEGLDRMEDWDLWLKCALMGARLMFVASEEPVALVRLHAMSSSRSLARMFICEAVRRNMNEVLEDPSDPPLNDLRLDDARAEAGRQLGLDGDPTKGLRYLLPVALNRRRLKWVLWSCALAIMELPGGTRLVRALRAYRTELRTSR